MKFLNFAHKDKLLLRDPIVSKKISFVNGEIFIKLFSDNYDKYQ